ncbi:MAG: aminotransferase class [Gemmatimonadetes bacterium]|nr:aminotransferase class [Gemmatimonadota bacterium]
MLTPRTDATMPTQMEAYFRALRAREFRRLDAQGHAYLDYTGAALYPESLVRTHANALVDGIYGNPHADGPSSRASTAAVEEARAAVLRFFDADPTEHTVCFTANASAALRLVGEAYPFARGSRFVLAADNHNSVNGIREFALRAGASVRYVPLDADLRMPDAEAVLRGADRRVPNLFAYPAQSNFSGVRHSLGMIDQARELGYDVLLDAAAFAPTSPLRLRDVRPDFVALSFYKMFGYPTGVGALIARRESLRRLRRPWFAGGTVEFVSTQHGMHGMKDGAEAFEDGTVNFLGIGALPAGLAMLVDVGMARIGHHLAGLTRLLLDRLMEMRHPNGAPLVRIHGPRDSIDRGATVALNVLDADGAPVDYERVEAKAREANVSVRGGCFCNPGAAEHAFAFPADDTSRCLESLSREGFSVERFRRCLAGPAVGAIRASLGLANVEADVHHFLRVVETFGESDTHDTTKRRRVVATPPWALTRPL